MIRFLLKGILRDRQRSLLPAIVVAIGVMLIVFLYCWLTGYLKDSIELNARFSTGHVKIMTRAYEKNIDQIPNDLAIMGADSLVQKLKQAFPDVRWEQRIHFGGLIDAPNEKGETRSQGPVIGFGIDLLSGDRSEIQRFNLESSLRRGKIPGQHGEILMSEEFSQKLKINPGDTVTLISSTMNGSMAMFNYKVAGTVVFGTGVMDRGSIIADIADTRSALDMNDAAGEIVGYFSSHYYDEATAGKVISKFNTLFNIPGDEYSPVIKSLSEQNNLAQTIQYISFFAGIMVFIFVFAMSIVLWNAGLIGGLRRYSEFGTRLAIGEDYGHIYKANIYESIMIGFLGSAAGTIIGLLISWYLQNHGMTFRSLMKDATILMPTTFHARITVTAWYIGFVPGLLSTVLGTMLSGIGIYKRKTAQLVKELES
jgi:putative ABC transport system permease protein